MGIYLYTELILIRTLIFTGFFRWSQVRELSKFGQARTVQVLSCPGEGRRWRAEECKGLRLSERAAFIMKPSPMELGSLVSNHRAIIILGYDVCMCLCKINKQWGKLLVQRIFHVDTDYKNLSRSFRSSSSFSLPHQEHQKYLARVYCRVFFLNGCKGLSRTGFVWALVVDTWMPLPATRLNVCRIVALLMNLSTNTVHIP